MKTCSKCGKEKRINEFHKNKKTRDNHQYQCKVCQSNYHKSYQIDYRVKNNERKFVTTPQSKFCPNCRILLESSKFYRDKGKKDGLHSYCKVCTELKKKSAE